MAEIVSCVFYSTLVGLVLAGAMFVLRLVAQRAGR